MRQAPPGSAFGPQDAAASSQGAGRGRPRLLEPWAGTRDFEKGNLILNSRPPQVFNNHDKELS